MKITINQDKCISCGRCTEICPSVFKLNSSGKIEIIDKKDFANCARKASDECIVEAIIITE